MELAKHLDKLEAFKAIAETGKLIEAGRIVNLTQPSLTRLIKTLETATGTKLFYRSRSGTVLTPAGEELLIYANNVLSPLKDLELRFKNLEDSFSGHLKVGSYESLAEYLWPSFLSSLKKKYENLSLSVQTSGSNAHISGLKSGLIDLLVDSEPRLSGDFDSFPLYTDYFCFYTHRDFREKSLSKAVIYVPNAFDENNVTLKQTVLKSPLNSHEKIELDSFTTARRFCEEGLGMAILPTRLAKSSKCLVSFKPSGITKKQFNKHTIYATTHSKKTNDKRVKLVIKELKSWFKT